MRGKPLSTLGPTPDPHSNVRVRAEPFVRRLARTAAAIESLKTCTDLLSRRDRNECRKLLEALELRARDTARRLERLTESGVVPDRQWARLEQACFETEEHLGYLAQTIQGRTSARGRLPAHRTTPSRRVAP